MTKTRLTGVVAKLSSVGPSEAPRRDQGPPSAYEQVTRQAMEDLTRQVERLEAKLNGILIALAGSLLIDLYRTLVR